MSRLSFFAVLFCLILLPAAAVAQTTDEPVRVPFNGLVVDLLGKPVRGVRVYTVDRNYFTTTDRKGRFGLTDVQPTDTVHLRYRGTAYDILVGELKSMRIILGDQVLQQVESSVELENLGYGYVDRRESVSSSSGISGEVLRRTGQVDLLRALQGLVPGLYVTEGQVYIRGISTINGSTEPLYIVDGVTVPSLEFVNIYDIESVEVMKDAFIYGSRGANGAILVTTKK